MVKGSFVRCVEALPGLTMCAIVGLAAAGLERLEIAATGRAWIEGLVLAILVGTALRTAKRPPAKFDPGIRVSARVLLEVAVALMGATVSLGSIVRVGPELLVGTIGTVAGAIIGSILLGRAFGLPVKMAVLVACGNAICGNSAIAAVAPAIDADSEDVAAAIAFTAVLGVGVVVLIPFIAALLHLSPTAGGALAGLTVYAVPQVIAAAAPMGNVAVQIGTLVKLVRVLMLGPVVATLCLLRSRRPQRHEKMQLRFSALQFFPWFIIAFVVLAILRSVNFLPHFVSPPPDWLGHGLTIVSMAGLGLCVDLGAVTKAGPRTTAVVILSFLLLFCAALLVLYVAGLAGGS